MATYRFQFTIKTADAVPANFITNTLYATAPDVAGAHDAGDIFTTMFRAWGSIYSTFVAQNNHLLKVYDMADATPRVPVYEETWNLVSAPSQPPLPSELAICLSFQADPLSGESQASRRGRIFIGPLASNTNDSGGRPSGTVRTNIVAAADAAWDSFVIAPGVKWVVYSEKLGTTAIVANGWVDNDFDVQRRRQQAVTARTVFPP